MEAIHHITSFDDVLSIQHEILDQLNRMEDALMLGGEMTVEIGKLRELHQVLVYKIEFLRRINGSDL